MKYLSICSGVEAATLAWHPLGWHPVGFAETKPFPCAVLRHHWPDVPNLGDINGYRSWDCPDFDVLVGGTPCQDFSIAGRRDGMGGDRGALTMRFVQIAQRFEPDWIVWENVPGCLSTNVGRDFGALLGALAKLGYGFAYRILDAQFVRVDGLERAVPQRRRRVFLVGYIGNWRRAAAVLFERESLFGHTPPGRTPRQGDTGTPVTGPEQNGRDGAPSEVAYSLSAAADKGDQDMVLAFEDRSRSNDGRGYDRGPNVMTNVSPTLNTVKQPAIAFDCKAGGSTGLSIGAVPGTMRGDGHGGGHLAIAIQERAGAENPKSGPDGAGFSATGASYTLEARHQVQSVCYDFRVSDWLVRRLTPLECERLQGMPDGHTLVPYRGGMAKDGPRYEACGNSMAVNVMRWIGQRIDLVAALPDP